MKLPSLIFSLAATAQADFKVTPACMAGATCTGFGVAFFGVWGGEEAFHSNHKDDAPKLGLSSVQNDAPKLGLSSVQVDEAIANAEAEAKMQPVGTLGSPPTGVGVSQLFFTGSDYNFELFLGEERTAANQGLFTVDSGSSNIIVNGNSCTQDLCTQDGPSKTLKQFQTPAASTILYAYQGVNYGDGSGYAFNVYSAPVTLPTGQTVRNANVGYNFFATPNGGTGTTDNFNQHGQGIFGLAYGCLAPVQQAALYYSDSTEIKPPYSDSTSSVQRTNTAADNRKEIKSLTASIVDDKLSTHDAFTVCLKGSAESFEPKEDGGSLVWGSEMPPGMPAADLDPACGYYSVAYESFELTGRDDGTSFQKFSALPLENSTKGAAQSGGCSPTVPVACAFAPIFDTGTTEWYLGQSEFDGLMGMITAFYETADPTLANFLDPLIAMKKTMNPQALPPPASLQKIELALSDYPVNITVNFVGTGGPSITKELTARLLSAVTISNDGTSILGQFIIDGHVLHFDRTNNQVGIESLAKFEENFGGCAKAPPLINVLPSSALEQQVQDAPSMLGMSAKEKCDYKRTSMHNRPLKLFNVQYPQCAQYYTDTDEKHADI